MILVTGSTGTVGSALLSRLRDRGPQVRALLHSADRTEAVTGLGAEPCLGAFEDRRSLERALEGVKGLFLLTPSNPSQVDWERSLVELAAAADVQRIVKLSVISADPEAPQMILRSHGRCEQAVAASGIPSTILRSNDFMQNFLLSADTIASEGRVYGTGVAGAPVAMVDTRDIASVAAEALSSNGATSSIHELTGPEAISFDQATRRIAAVLGREIAYRELPGEDYVEGLTGAGLPAWRAQSLRELYESYGEGLAEQVSPAVAELSGSQPRTIEVFARDHARRLLAT